MDFNKLIGGAIEQAATDQIKDKAVKIAGEAVEQIFTGKDEEGDDKKEGSGFDVGGIIKNVTAGNDDSGGGIANTIGSLFK